MSDLILKPEDFGHKIYGLFPPSYRDDDVHTNYALKRYLDACGDGGFKYAIEDLNGLLDLANPDQATPQALPLLFQQYGLDVFYGIPEMYLRYLLPRLGEAWAKKGSIDVINFVASAIAGVRTSTWVKCDQNDNVDVDLLFEMDYAIGDYFPDTKQLCRLLERFLPFYLGINLVYVYVFHDKFTLHGNDSIWHDLLTITQYENGILHAPGLFHDDISARYSEAGSFSHKFVPGLSTEVDSHIDKTFLAPVTDVIQGVAEDSIKDHVVIKPSFCPTLNTGLVLNDSFILNEDNCEYARIHGVIEDSFSTTKVIYREETALSNAESALDEVSLTVKEQVSVSVAEGTVEHLTDQPSAEEGLVRAEDNTETLTVQNTTEEAAFVFSPLLCMFTNTLGHVLNVATLDVPNEVDIIRYQDGTCHTVFI